MEPGHNIKNRTTQSWTLNQLTISHNVIDYDGFGRQVAKNNTDVVRLHFGLKGRYEFYYRELDASFDLSGHHNNIMYSKGLELEILNKSSQIETFGINFNTSAFINIAQNGNDLLKRFAEKVVRHENAIFSSHWQTNNFKIQQVIQDIIHCPYHDALKNLFLLSKSIELLVLQADAHDQHLDRPYIKSATDRKKLIEAKELLTAHLNQPPTINTLAKRVGLNEYKLKKGFKELFGTTVFGYIHHNRMQLAKRLLLETEQSAKQIAYAIGYSSPQHFSKAFKKAFGVTPNSIRNTPDSTID